MRFSILRFVSYFLAFLWDRRLLLEQWATLTPRRQYLTKIGVLLLLLLTLGVAAWKENVLEAVGFVAETTGVLHLLSVFWRWSPKITSRARNHVLFSLGLLAVNTIAIFKMPYGQRAISMATSSLAFAVIFVILSKLGRIARTCCCCCVSCCRDVCTEAGDLLQLPPTVS